MRQPYPLQWPPGWTRTDADKRERALFRVSLSDAITDLLYDLRLMGAANVVVTSDLPTSSKGLPYSSGKAEDPGIVVWCVIDGSERAFACDRWTTPAANLRAIGKTVEALRKIGDWGAADMVSRAFSGFAALPPPAGAESAAPTTAPRGWRVIFGKDITDAYEMRLVDKAKTLETIRLRYRQAMKVDHPDVGGTHERAAELNAALQEAESELGGSS
jgi:hypothetical protein